MPNDDKVSKIRTYMTEGGPQDAPLAVAAFGAVLVGLVVIAWCVGGTSYDRALLILSSTVGGLLGWLVGIILSPYAGEEKEFSKLATGISGFVSGYALTKVDEIWKMFMDQKGYTNPAYGQRIAFAVAGFLLVLVLTFVTRRYSTPSLRIAPDTATLQPNQTQLFSAFVDNLGVAGVKWLVHPAVGTIDDKGLFTAPSDPSGEEVTVVAVNLSQPEIYGKATVTLTKAN